MAVVDSNYHRTNHWHYHSTTRDLRGCEHQHCTDRMPISLFNNINEAARGDGSGADSRNCGCLAGANEKTRHSERHGALNGLTPKRTARAARNHNKPLLLASTTLKLLYRYGVDA